MKVLVIRVSIVSVFAASVVALGTNAQAPAWAHATHKAALVTKIKSSACEALFYGGYVADAPKIRKQMNDAGLTDVTMVGGDGIQASAAATPAVPPTRTSPAPSATSMRRRIKSRLPRETQRPVSTV